MCRSQTTRQTSSHNKMHHSTLYMSALYLYTIIIIFHESLSKVPSEDHQSMLIFSELLSDVVKGTWRLRTWK